MRLSRQFAALAFLAGLPTGWSFNLVKDYSGQTFFQGWDFYGYWDNLTNGSFFFHLPPAFCRKVLSRLGQVWWVDQVNATQQQLAYVNSDGRAIIKVDNTSTLVAGDKRNTVSTLPPAFRPQVSIQTTGEFLPLRTSPFPADLHMFGGFEFLIISLLFLGPIDLLGFLRHWQLVDNRPCPFAIWVFRMACILGERTIMAGRWRNRHHRGHQPHGPQSNGTTYDLGLHSETSNR